MSIWGTARGCRLPRLQSVVARKVMLMKTIKQTICLSGAVLCGLGDAVAHADVANRPNIIFILADDLGYGDLSCYNPTAQGTAPNNTLISTPQIDSLATNGARMVHFYSAAPVCSPSRRALLTARYANRLGEWAEAYAGAPFDVEAAKEPTIGMWLKQAGYATAVYGKWNVGDINGVSRPDAHGFDDWLIIDHNTGYFQHQNDNADCHGQEMLFKTGGERVTDRRGEYLDDIFAGKAIDFINANKGKPFFLYLPFSTPHTPLQDPENPALGYAEGPDGGTAEGRAVYVKMVEHLDGLVGQILQTLQTNNLAQNTLVVFTSDNGGSTAANNWPLRQRKLRLEEGGVRVPCLIRWPGVVSPGTVSTQPSIMMDASVTVLAAAGALQYVPTNRVLDGENLLPLQGGIDRARSFGWRMRDWDQTANWLHQEAYFTNGWKFIRTYDVVAGTTERLPTYKEALYDLTSDIGEATNLATVETNQFNSVRNDYMTWKTNTVDLDADFLVWFADQTGSPDQARLDAYLPTALNTSGKNYVPNPAPGATVFDVFDYTWDGIMQGRLYTNGNETLVSSPVISNGVISVQLQPGCVAPYPMLYREGYIDTSRFSVLKIRLRVTGGGSSPLTAKALLRYSGWAGQDIPFSVPVDGIWHEYSIDVSLSTAWAKWVRTGRIGLVFPVPSGSSATVDIDTMQLESRDGFYQMSLHPSGGQGLSVRYPSLIGRTNSLLYRASLSDGSWSVVSNHVAGNGEVKTLITANGDGKQGFYKLMEE